MLIEREIRGEVVVLRMDHGKVNALDLELLTALTGSLDELAATAPPVVLTGAGKSFSGGVDLRRISTEPAGYIDDYLAALSTAFRTLFRYPAPTVAAINGHAIAGGYVLAAACDYRIAADAPCRIGLSELRVGVPFPTAAIEIVRHAVGGPIAAQLALGAELVDVTVAASIGLVDELSRPAELVGTAVTEAATRAERGRQAYLHTKRQLQRPAWDNIERVAPIEDEQVRQMWSGPDGLDRIRDFLALLKSGD